MATKSVEAPSADWLNILESIEGVQMLGANPDHAVIIGARGGGHPRVKARFTNDFEVEEQIGRTLNG